MVNNYRKKYPERSRQQYEKYYKINKQEILKKNNLYRENNKEKLKQKTQERRMNKKLVKFDDDIELENIMRIKKKKESFIRYVNNPKNINYYVAHSLRNRIRLALKAASKKNIYISVVSL